MGNQTGGYDLQHIPIPNDVKVEAMKGIRLLDAGFLGGTQTGWDRAEQLVGDSVDIETLATMRAWFARHGPDAINGGTSYVGYRRWMDNGSPFTGSHKEKSQYRGAVAWLIWGGDAAYLWLKTPEIRQLLEREFPNRQKASPENNLS